MMLFCTFRVVGTQLEATYKWRMTGDGLFLSMGVPRNCPINGCRGGVATSTCRDQICGLFCHRWHTCACVKLRSPALPTLSGPERPSFAYMVMPKVSGATIVDGALPGFTGRGLIFLCIQYLWEVASSGGKKACGASGVVCHHGGAQNINER